MKKQFSTKKALMLSVLSLCLCCAMLVGTTFAWFTDSVTSKGNIIQTGTLDVTMEWADGAKDPAAADTVWTDASTGAMFDYANWEPGYAVARHIKVTNIGTLALNYQMRIVANGVVSKLADVIDVYYIDEDAKAERADIENAAYLGTLTAILQGVADTDGDGVEDTTPIHKKVIGSLEAGDPADVHTIILKMKESAGNEYQNMDLGCTFSVELTATQMSAESDSFGPDYDLNDDTTIVVPSPEIPAALVRELDELTIANWSTSFPYGTTEEDALVLNAGYKFQPTETLEEALQSEYLHWHADFAVKADRDVPADSIVLAGYYSMFCDGWNNGNWVALTNAGMAVPAGDEIRLVEGMRQGAINVTYKDLCQYGNDGKGFQCGIAAANDVAAKLLAGTTITVELRMYETAGDWTDSSHNSTETGHYETIGVFTYTFPVLNYVDSAEDMAAELAAGNSVALNKDIVVSSTMNVASGANVDIDLNGHNLSYAVDNNGKASAIIANKGNMKIFGEGTISFVAADPDLDAIPSYATNTITNTGTLVIGEGVVVENGSDGGASYAVDVQSGKFVLDGGTLIGKRCALRIARYNADAEFVMNSGKVIGATPAWIQLPGSDSNTAPSIKVEINGGTFQSTKATSADNNVMYTYSFGNSHANTKIVINDGEFLGGTLSIGTGYYGDAPTLTINGGTFEYDVLQWNADGSATVLYAANK